MCFVDAGDVYVWDLQTRDCVHRFQDGGCVHGLSVDVSPNAQYVACGCVNSVPLLINVHMLRSGNCPDGLCFIFQLFNSIN